MLLQRLCRRHLGLKIAYQDIKTDISKNFNIFLRNRMLLIMISVLTKVSYVKCTGRRFYHIDRKLYKAAGTFATVLVEPRLASGKTKNYPKVPFRLCFNTFSVCIIRRIYQTTF